VHKCALFHTGAIEERARKFLAAPKQKGRESPRDSTVVRHASGETSRVIAETGAPAAVQAAPKHVVHLEGAGDWFTVALDTSGAPLHQRGWRNDAAKMPLKSTHAAALLLNAGPSHRLGGS
jgi:23S rRNA (guanine2445-N2)-methyltransferase / 23S rRNA (guanine2069-N7)-methyltransferase